MIMLVVVDVDVDVDVPRSLAHSPACIPTATA